MTIVPGQILDLSVWKINQCDPALTQVTQPALNTYSSDYFRTAIPVAFTAPVGGTVQAGAKYPRSELREMNADGSAAAWSTTSGTHVMQLAQRVTHLPAVKSEVVAGQIHDAASYQLLIRVNATQVLAQFLDGTTVVLDPSYVAGDYMAITITATGGNVTVAYNGIVKITKPISATGCYFKAGCYTQSNPSTGDDPNDFGQVEVVALTVTHS